jgi:hypothetical protein
VKSLRKSYTRQVKEAAKRAAEEAANWEQLTSKKLLALEHAGKGDSAEASSLLRERELRNLPVALASITKLAKLVVQTEINLANAVAQLERESAERTRLIKDGTEQANTARIAAERKAEGLTAELAALAEGQRQRADHSKREQEKRLADLESNFNQQDAQRAFKVEEEMRRVSAQMDQARVQADEAHAEMDVLIKERVRLKIEVAEKAEQAKKAEEAESAEKAERRRAEEQAARLQMESEEERRRREEEEARAAAEHKEWEEREQRIEEMISDDANRRKLADSGGLWTAAKWLASTGLVDEIAEQMLKRTIEMMISPQSSTGSVDKSAALLDDQYVIRYWASFPDEVRHIVQSTLQAPRLLASLTSKIMSSIKDIQEAADLAAAEQVEALELASTRESVGGGFPSPPPSPPATPSGRGLPMPMPLPPSGVVAAKERASEWMNHAGSMTRKRRWRSILGGKFVAENAFTFSLGMAETFHNGLVGAIGTVSTTPGIDGGGGSGGLLEIMREEHVSRNDSMIPFEGGNYGTWTNSKIEFFFVVDPRGKQAVAALKDPSSAAVVEPSASAPLRWPTEQGCEHPRQPCTMEEVRKRPDGQQVDAALRGLGMALHDPELAAARLYTGPMYSKYNVALRATAGGEFERGRFQELCHGNGYVASLHAINSALLKLSRLTEVSRVLYRGCSDGVLPRTFWEADADGFRGGVELGIMSTTFDKKVALQYARACGHVSQEQCSARSTIIEISQGLADRGADLSWLSQYPDEKEVAFPPCTGLQVEWAVVDSQTPTVMTVRVRPSTHRRPQPVCTANNGQNRSTGIWGGCATRSDADEGLIKWGNARRFKHALTAQEAYQGQHPTCRAHTDPGVSGPTAHVTHVYV